jgi:hypothetical protein
MAEYNIIPLMESTAPATINDTVTRNDDYAVNTDKRWLIGIIELEAGAQDVDLDVDIQVDRDGGGYNTIWDPQIDNFRFIAVHLATKYPRSVELEDGDTLRIKWVNTSGGNITLCGSRVYIIESDL